MVLIKNYNPRKEETFEQLIERGLRNYEHKHSRNGRVYVSDTLCTLKTVYGSNYEGEELEDFKKFHFVKGGMGAEEVSIYSLKKTHSLLFSNYKIPDVGINMGGKVDSIIYFKEKIWVWECKQIGTIPSSPKKEHEAQAVIYSAITGLPAILYYVKRNVIGPYPHNPEHKAFVLDTSYENRFKYLCRAVKAHLYSERKLIPKKQPFYMKKSWCPDHCKLKKHCWGEAGFPINPGLDGFKLANIYQEQEIDKEGDRITEQILNETVARDRFTGVLNHINKESKHLITKSVLSGEWNKFFDC